MSCFTVYLQTISLCNDDDDDDDDDEHSKFQTSPDCRSSPRSSRG